MPEFSRPLQVDVADADGTPVVLRAGAAECAALALRLGLQELSSLRVDVHLRHTSAGLVRLNVDFSANVVQSCVASLEAVPGGVADRFSVLCDRAEKRRSGRKSGGADEGEVFVDPFGDDPIETLEDGMIDVGELVTQHLSLSLDPYPRAPGIAGEMDVTSAGGEKTPAGSADGDEDGSKDGSAGGGADGGENDTGKTKTAFAALQDWRPEKTG